MWANPCEEEIKKTRKVRDILETPSRMLFAISRQQPQPSEIGA